MYELLAQKFQLFEGVFGASDEVPGTIGSGVDFERRIAGRYQTCRNPEQIVVGRFQVFNGVQTARAGVAGDL